MLEVIKIILAIGVMLTSIPAGLILAYLCREELKELRKGFYALIVICLFIVLGLELFYKKGEIILGLVYISIVSFICIIKGKKKAGK